jgi:uncharacterized oligopeptide transporter (OPT) family protein
MAASGSAVSTHRTDRDIPLPLCCAIIAGCILPFYVVISLYMQDWAYTILLSFFVVVFGFFASAIAAYMAGWCVYFTLCGAESEAMTFHDVR